MHPSVVAAKAEVVLAVNPAQCLRKRDGLRSGKARLRLAQPAKPAQPDLRHTIIQRAGVQRSPARTHDPKVRRNILAVGEEVRRLAAAAVPVGAEDVGHFLVAQRVTGLQRVRIRRSLPAQLRKNIHVVLGRVAPVVIEVDALPQSLVLIPAVAASASATPTAGWQRRVLPQRAHIAHARLS